MHLHAPRRSFDEKANMVVRDKGTRVPEREKAMASWIILQDDAATALLLWYFRRRMHYRNQAKSDKTQLFNAPTGTGEPSKIRILTDSPNCFVKYILQTFLC